MIYPERAYQVLSAGGEHIPTSSPGVNCYTAVLTEALQELARREGPVTTQDLDREILMLQPWVARSCLQTVLSGRDGEHICLRYARPEESTEE